MQLMHRGLGPNHDLGGAVQENDKYGFDILIISGSYAGHTTDDGQRQESDISFIQMS